MFGFVSYKDLPEDGFGQSTMSDLRFAARFRKFSKRSTVWRRPTEQEERYYDQHHVWSRFGNETYAITEIEGETWIVRERIWHGWPDPERYIFLALAGDDVRCATDFDHWPQAWTLLPLTGRVDAELQVNA